MSVLSSIRTLLYFVFGRLRVERELVASLGQPHCQTRASLLLASI
jgi:hypothetical protein